MKKLFKAIQALISQGKPVPDELKEAMSFGDIRDKLIEQIDPKDANGNRTYRYWINMDCVFPDHVIVEDEHDKKHYRVDYTMDAQENVTIGQWQEVEQVWQVKPGGATLPAPDTTKVTESAEDMDLSNLSVLVEAPADPEGKSFRVCVIRPGWNVTLDGKPGDKYYTRESCASLVPLLANAQAYADHPLKSEENQRPERSIRDLIGWYSDPKQEVDGRTTATLHVLESAAWLRSLLKEAPHLVGISINGYGSTRMGEAEGRRGKLVESINILRSADVVTKAGAGGQIEQLVASAASGKKEDDTVDWNKITIDELRQNRPDLVTEIGQQKLTEAKAEFKQEFDTLKESINTVAAENKTLREELSAERIKNAIREKITSLLKESKLPDISQKRLCSLLEARDYTKDGAVDETALTEAVNAAVEDEKAYLGKLTESGRVVGMGGGEPANPVEQVKKVQGKFDKMFGVEEKPAAGE